MGYVGYEKSERAVKAEREGKLTATALAKALRVDTIAIREHCKPCEWHHTSCRYNETEYYWEPALLQAAGIEQEDVEHEEVVAASDLLLEMRTEASVRRNSSTVTVRNVTVEWLEWDGIGKRARCTERKEKNCTVSFRKGMNSVTIKLRDGRTFIKRKTTKGFYVNGKPGVTAIEEN